MKQTMQFSVGGEVVQVPQDEMDEFNAVAKQNGDTPEPVFTYRVSGKDGTADEVDVPKSQYGEFEKIAKERGDRIEPMRLLTLDDGTERLMSMNDLHEFFSSNEKAQAAQTADIDAEDLKRLGSENLQEVAANEAIRGMKDIDPNDVPTAQPPMDGGEVMRQSNERFMRDMREGKVYDKSPTEAFFGELGRRMFTAEGIRETAQESGSARPYAYLNDLANSLVGGLLKGSAKIEEGFGRIWGEAGDALGNRGMKDAAQAMVSDAQAGQAAVERNLPTDMLDTKGPGAVNKVLQVGKNVAEMTGEFAPAAIPGVGQAYAASLVGAGTVNRYAQVYDEAIQHGLDPRKAEGLAFGAASVDALANMLLMGKFRGIWSGEKKAMADMAKKRFVQRALDVGLETAKVGGTMATNGAWQEIVDEGAQGATNPDWAKVGKVAFDQFIEGGLFHLVNSGAHHATRIDWSREPDGIPAGAARDMMESPEGRALIFCNSPQAAAQIFRARKNGEDVSRKMIRDLGLSENTARTVADRNAIGDRLLEDYQAFKERVRTKMDDVQASALADEIASRFDDGYDNRTFEKVWSKAVAQIKDAREIDDPERRKEIVDAALSQTGDYSPKARKETPAPVAPTEKTAPKPTEPPKSGEIPPVEPSAGAGAGNGTPEAAKPVGAEKSGSVTSVRVDDIKPGEHFTYDGKELYRNKDGEIVEIDVGKDGKPIERPTRRHFTGEELVDLPDRVESANVNPVADVPEEAARQHLTPEGDLKSGGDVAGAKPGDTLTVGKSNFKVVERDDEAGTIKVSDETGATYEVNENGEVREATDGRSGKGGGVEGSRAGVQQDAQGQEAEGDRKAGTDRDKGRTDGGTAEGKGGVADKGAVAVDRTGVPEWLDDEGVAEIFKAGNFIDGWGSAVSAFFRHRVRTDEKLAELRRQFAAETDEAKRKKLNNQYEKRVNELWEQQGTVQPQDEMRDAINAIQKREGSAARANGQAQGPDGKHMTDAARKRASDVKELTGSDFDELNLTPGDLMKFRKLHENYAKGEEGAADALKKFVEDLQAKEKPIDIPEKPNVPEEGAKAESPAPKAEKPAPKKDLKTAVRDLAKLRDSRSLLDGTKFTGEDAQANREANEAEKARIDREIEAAEAEIESLREPSKPIPPPDKPIKPNPKKAAKIVGDFVATDPTRKGLMKPYHDKKNGVVVATNGRFIIATKHGFDPNAKEPEEPFPNWQIVIPKEKDLNASIAVNPTELAKVCQSAIRLTRAVGIKPSDANSTPHVILRNSKGGYSILDANYLLTVAKAMEANGITELRVQDTKGEPGVVKPLMAKNADTTIVIMPLRGVRISSAGRIDGTNVAFDGTTGRIIHAPERTDVGALGYSMSEERLKILRDNIVSNRKNAEFGARNTELFKMITDAWKRGEKDPNAIYKGFNGEQTFDSLTPENKKTFMEFLNAGSEEELARMMAEYRARKMPDAPINRWVDKDPKEIAKIEKRIAAEDEVESLLMRDDEAREMFGMEPRKQKAQAEPPKAEAPKAEKPAEESKPAEEAKPATTAMDKIPSTSGTRKRITEAVGKWMSEEKTPKDVKAKIRASIEEATKKLSEAQAAQLAEAQEAYWKARVDEKNAIRSEESGTVHAVQWHRDATKARQKANAEVQSLMEKFGIEVDGDGRWVYSGEGVKPAEKPTSEQAKPITEKKMRAMKHENVIALPDSWQKYSELQSRLLRTGDKGGALAESPIGKKIKAEMDRMEADGWGELYRAKMNWAGSDKKTRGEEPPDTLDAFKEWKARKAETPAKPAAEKRLTPETATVEDVTKIMSDRWNEVHAKDANYKPSEPKNFARTAEQLLKNIREKNADGLISTMNGLNPASLRAFEVLTGIKMPRSQRDQHALIDKFCGVTPEARAKIEADRKAEREAKYEAERRAQSLAEGEKIMKDTRVRMKDGEVVTAQKLLEDGWTVKRVKRGAASNTHLVAPDGSGYFKIDGKAFEYAEDFIAKRGKAEKPAGDGKSFLPGGVIEARYGQESDEGPQPDGWRKLGVGKKGPVVLKVPDNETFKNFVEKNYGKVVGEADVNAGGVEIEGGDIYNVNQILGHMAGATGKVEKPMREGGKDETQPVPTRHDSGRYSTSRPEGSIPQAESADKAAKKSRATSAVEEVANALTAKDFGAGKSAMDKLRKAIAEGEAFPDKDAVAELAKSVPPELRKSFMDSMSQWREHAETIANAPAIANAGRNEVIDRMSEGVRPTGFHEADDGVHFEYGDKDVVVKGDAEEVLKWARDRNVFKAEVDAEKKAAADAFNADAFEIGSDGKKKPLVQDNKAAMAALKRLGVTAGLPDADLRRELRRCEAHRSDPRFAQRAEDIKAILEYRKAHENVQPREGGSFAGEVSDDDMREMAVLDIPGKKIAFLDNVADMASVHWDDPESIKQYLLGHIGERFNSIATGEAIELGNELPDEFSRSNSAEAERRNIKRIAKARTKLATGLGDAIQSAGESTPEPARDKQREGGVYYRRPFTFALRGGDGQIKVYDADLLTYKVNGVEQLYDAVHIRDNTTPGIAGAVEQTVSNVRPSRTTEGSALPSHNAVSAGESIPQTSAGGKPKSDMVVAYEATKVLSNFIPGVKVEVEKDGAKQDSAATPIHSKAGTVVGTWNRKTKTLTLKRGATLETVAHELGGHALWQYAEQHPELGLKSTLEAWAKDAPPELVDAIKKAYPNITGEKLMEEIFAHRFGREKSGKIAEALQTREGRKWYQKVWDSIKSAWRSMAARFGGNRIDLNAIADMTPEEAVDFIADQLVRGKTLGKLNMTRPEDVEVEREMRRVNPAPTPLMERSRWTRDWYMRNMADRFHDVLSLERDLVATSGVGIDAKDSAYHALRVSSGRKEAKRREIQHISDRADKIFNDNRGKITSEDVAKFLLAQAAPDRNAKILRRSGGAKTEGAGISDTDAAQIIADLTAAGKMPILQEFEAIRKELTDKYGVDYLADNGIIDRETAERLKAEEPHYVPMRDDYTDENGFDLNSSRRLELPPLKTAHGRSDMADHPLAFLFMQAADNVARVEANIVRQKMARIVQRNAALGVGRVRGQRIVPDYDVATGNTALVVDKLDTERENPNILVFREKGKKKVIEFNGPRGALVVKAVRGEGIKRGPEFLQKMSRAWAATATQYSPLGFKTNNAIKDSTEVLMNISEDEGVGTGAKFLALRASAFANGYAATMRDYIKTGNFSGKKGERLREFVENGGLIGGGVREGYQEIEQRFADAAKVMSRIDNAKNKPLAMLEAMRDKITFSNEMTENLSRFINYDVRRSAGESVEEAIIAAREDSTDFNMYGNQRWINNVRVFSNSILGGTMRATRQVAKHPIKTATSLVMLGIIEELADAAINNKDDEEREIEGLGTGQDISEYERSQTMRLRVGGKYVRIPFHLGPFSLLKYIGNNAGRAITGKIGWIEASENVAKEAATVGFHFSGWGEVSFGEDGPSLFNSASPTLAQLVVQLKTNENFMGGQIRKEHNFPGKRDLPDSSFSKPQTGEGWEIFAKLVNRIGGGDEFRKAYFTWLDNAPEDYKYAFEQVFKNTGKDVLQTWDTSKRAVESVKTGENKMVLNDVPVLNKVFRSVPENDSRYYKMLRAYDKAMTEYSNTTDIERRQKIEKDIPAIGCLKGLSDNITDMRKQELEAKDEREKESIARQRRKEQAKFIRIMSGKDHSHDADFRQQRIIKAADALTEHETDQLDPKKKESLLRALEGIPAKEIESALSAFGGELVTVRDKDGNEKDRERWSEKTLQDRIDRLLELIQR